MKLQCAQTCWSSNQSSIGLSFWLSIEMAKIQTHFKRFCHSSCDPNTRQRYSEITITSSGFHRFCLTFLFHPHCQTFIQSTSLASVSMNFVHWAGSISLASVVQVLPHTSFEKAFATFTSHDAIMLPCATVTTDQAIAPDRL